MRFYVNPEHESARRHKEMREIDADKLMNEFGPSGRFQLLCYYLCMLFNFYIATSIFQMPFIQAQPETVCINKDTLLPVTDWYDQSVKSVPSACYIRPPPGDKQYECNENDTALVVVDTAPVNSLIYDYDLACSHYIWREAGLSLSTIGAIFVVPFISHLSDRYGRKPLMIITLAVSFVFNALAAVAPWYWLFLLCRFIVGGFLDGLGTIAQIMSCEMVAQETRSWVGLVYTMAWVAGYLYVGLLSVITLSWRMFYILTFVPSLIAFSYFFWLPESPHWLAAHGKTKRLREYINDAITFNNRAIDLKLCTLESDRRETRRSYESHKDGQYRRALCKPMFFVFILINGYLMFITQLYYFALTLTSVSMSSDPFLGFMLSGFIEIPGGLIVIPLMKYFGRKSLTIGSLVLQGAFIVGYPFAQAAGYEWLAISLNLSGKLANGVIQVVHPVLVTEMMPTKMRTMIYAVVNVPQSLGTLVAPYMKHLSFGYDWLPSVVLTVLSIIGALLTLILPETKGKPMPEDIEEMDHGPFGFFFRHKSAKVEPSRRSSKRSSKSVNEPSTAPQKTSSSVKSDGTINEKPKKIK
uniref:MFS domain-containing protein n=1 Tax=Panagrellus redivivus TaxID=6233 RepID=A0A7E4V6K7_PANRE